MNHRERDFCISEFFNPGSCTYRRCMFKHAITDDNRQDQCIIDRLQRKRRDIETRREVNADNGGETLASNQKEICLTAFQNGENSCKAECPHEHNLNYQRIRKGICYFYISGTCHREDKCWFSHEIPSSIKAKPEVMQASAAFVKRMKDKKSNSSTESVENTSNNNRKRGNESSLLDEEKKNEQQFIRVPSSPEIRQRPAAEIIQTNTEQPSPNQFPRDDQRIPSQQQPANLSPVIEMELPGSKSVELLPKNAVPRVCTVPLSPSTYTNQCTTTTTPIQYQTTETTPPSLYQPSMTTMPVQYGTHPLHHYQQQNLHGPQNGSGNPQTITYDHFLFLMKHFTQCQSNWFNPNNQQQY